MSTKLAVILVAFLLFLIRFRNAGHRPKGYPPGPPTLPVIGNLHQMPIRKGHLQFQRWAEEYGPIYSLILGTKILIVLSSDQAVKDLLDKRGGIYSSRPERYIAQDMISGGRRVVLMKYDETLRTIRKLAHRILNINVSDTYIPYQDLESKSMLMGMLQTPDKFIDHIRHYTTSLTTQMAFGFRMKTMEDPRAKQMFDGFRRFNELAGSQTALLLDVFPILRHLPDLVLPVRRYAKKLGQEEHSLFLAEYRKIKRKVSDGQTIPCFCLDLVNLQQEQKFSDIVGAYVTGSFLQAGSETTSAELIGFIQAMVIFPEVSKLAQAELDSVCGNRLPDLSDIAQLPYIRGCVKETLRWMPTDISVPHAVSCEDHYMGYTIPKDAGIVWNVWAIHNDPKRHPNPRKFDPSRWSHDQQTSAEAATNPDVTKRDHFVYGAGRRLCQGMHIADRSLFLAIARLLWTFEFKRAIDEKTGQEIVPDMEHLSEGLFVAPEPFEANITPRDESKATRVKEEWGKMMELLDEDLQWKLYPKDLVWKTYREDRE
ncbi:cytochrome P450 [Annulohypoxylon bovei var. microspora]|nr:cytochrome P450 [Annulohypoxylon bovei var. microspora]